QARGNLSRRQDHFRGTRIPLLSGPLPLARRRARQLTRLPRSLGHDDRRTHHGPPTPAHEGRGRAVPPRINPDDRGQEAAREFFEVVDFASFASSLRPLRLNKSYLTANAAT